MSVLNAGDLVITRQGQEVRETHPPAANLHQPLVEDFVEAVRSGRAPFVDGEVGRAVAEIEAQIYTSDVDAQFLERRDADHRHGTRITRIFFG